MYVARGRLAEEQRNVTERSRGILSAKRAHDRCSYEVKEEKEEPRDDDVVKKEPDGDRFKPSDTSNVSTRRVGTRDKKLRFCQCRRSVAELQRETIDN